MITNSNQLELFINLVKNNKNPQQLVTNMLQQRSKENPIYGNIFQLIQDGKTNEIENIVRNMAAEKGINFDQEFNNFKKMF